MSLKTTIEDDCRRALKENESARLSTLRMALAALKNREIEKRTRLSKSGMSGEELEEGSVLTDEETLGVIRSEFKKRRDAEVEFKKGGRNDLAEKEKTEALILEWYLPAEVPDEEVEKAVREAVAALGVATEKDFGRVMGEAMKRLKGQAGGERVSAMVKKLLEG